VKITAVPRSSRGRWGDGSVSSAALRPGGRMTCRRVVTASPTGRFGCEGDGKGLITRFTGHYAYVSAIPRRGINFAGDTLPRARRGITRAVKAPASSRSCSIYANPTAAMYLCAIILRLRRARDRAPASGRSILEPSTSALLSLSLSLYKLYNRIM